MTNILLTKVFSTCFMGCLVIIPVFLLWWEMFRRDTRKIEVEQDVPY